jgi:hypothetical protein
MKFRCKSFSHGMRALWCASWRRMAENIPERATAVPSCHDNMASRERTTGSICTFLGEFGVRGGSFDSLQMVQE